MLATSAHPHRPRLIALTVPLLVLGSASCVSQARHDDTLAQLKYYQRGLQDLESYQGKLEAENERLKRELALREGEPIEAGVTREIDERLQELRGLVAGMEATPGDVTVLAVEGGYGLRVTDAVLFDSGSAAIKPQGRALLLDLAEEVRSQPFERIWVRGHTDSDPVVKPETRARFPHGNLELSAARAIEVAGLLASEGGLPEERIVVAGFGPNEPVAPNASPEEKRRNRRVEIFVLEDPAVAGTAN